MVEISSSFRSRELGPGLFSAAAAAAAASTARLLSGAARSELDPDSLEAAESANTALQLLSDAARSEHYPDLLLKAAAANTATDNTATDNTATANTAINSITGAFADPWLEVAFAAQLFRIAFPVHVLLSAIMLACWASLASLDYLAYWAIFELASCLGLVGRVLLHRMHDKVRGQRMGSWTWTALVMVCCIADVGSYTQVPAAACQHLWPEQYVVPLMFLAGSLTNASHGLSFFHKLALLVVMLVDGFVAIAVCREGSSTMKSAIGVGVLGSACAHVVEIQLRRSYAERVQENEGLVEDSFQKERRLEQLQTSNERMMYDLQRRGRPLNDDGDRNVIRRGLQAGPSRHCYPYPGTSDTGPSEAGGSTASDSPPPSLPPGAPSSSASETMTPPLTWTEADRIDPQWLAAQGATQSMDVEGLVPARSLSSTGFEGVYASGVRFGAELQFGSKRFRQDDFRSAREAALERSRWVAACSSHSKSNAKACVECTAGSYCTEGVKSLGESKTPLEVAAEASSEREQLAAETLVDMAMKEAAVQQRVCTPRAHGQLCMPKPVLAMPAALGACSPDPGKADRQWLATSAGLAYSAAALQAPSRSAVLTNAVVCAWRAQSEQVALQLKTSSSPNVACTMPAASALTTGSFLPLPAPPSVTSYVPPRGSAPPNSTPVSPAKRAYMTPYTRFCQEQRPYLPTNLCNSVREKTLGVQWGLLSKAEKDRYN